MEVREEEKEGGGSAWERGKWVDGGVGGRESVQGCTYVAYCPSRWSQQVCSSSLCLFPLKVTVLSDVLCGISERSSEIRKDEREGEWVKEREREGER